MDQVLFGIIKELNGLYNDVLQAERVFFDVTNQTRNTLKLIHAYEK
jgi:hypothetical protein